MVHVSNRSIQGMNILLSSWAVVLMVMGITLDEWVELISEDEGIKINHSPWMICCPAVWPEDDLKVVRIMMMSVLGLSFLLNFILGMKFTYLIPQNKSIQLFTAILSFSSGILLLWALTLYHNKLKQGQSMHFSSYRITWIMNTAYLNVFFLSVCGILSLLECKLSTSSSTCLNIHTSDTECKESEKSIEGISLPEHTAMPRSIVRAHTVNSKEDILNKQVQTRRVTWAL
ncbi:LOW QUALITY PROTEIN: transmembrane protein 225 [Rhinopithecus roxellana]|uniref:Transmembrane protein 225 n=1 Tax=Rhinopithecus roxellana TaxID=61622 RepID=A0A2K6Q195_RHIRO|nr:LOW QUALITY PROTEIN: transmembrane protein 225 [Rhinopithecus roxellana]